MLWPSLEIMSCLDHLNRCYYISSDTHIHLGQATACRYLANQFHTLSFQTISHVMAVKEETLRRAEWDKLCRSEHADVQSEHYVIKSEQSQVLSQPRLGLICPLYLSAGMPVKAISFIGAFGRLCFCSVAAPNGPRKRDDSSLRNPAAVDLP